MQVDAPVRQGGSAPRPQPMDVDLPPPGPVDHGMPDAAPAPPAPPALPALPDDPVFGAAVELIQDETDIPRSAAQQIVLRVQRLRPQLYKESANISTASSLPRDFRRAIHAQAGALCGKDAAVGLEVCEPAVLSEGEEEEGAPPLPATASAPTAVSAPAAASTLAAASAPAPASAAAAARAPASGVRSQGPAAAGAQPPAPHAQSCRRTARVLRQTGKFWLVRTNRRQREEEEPELPAPARRQADKQGKKGRQQGNLHATGRGRGRGGRLK